MSVAFWRRKLKRECLQDVKCWASTHSTDVKRKLHEAQPFCSPWYTLLHFLSYIFLHSYSSTLFSQSTNSPGENNDADSINDLDSNDGDDWGQVHTENEDNCFADRYRPLLREVDIFEKNAFSDISFYRAQDQESTLCNMNFQNLFFCETMTILLLVKEAKMIIQLDEDENLYLHPDKESLWHVSQVIIGEASFHHHTIMAHT